VDSIENWENTNVSVTAAYRLTTEFEDGDEWA